MVAIYSSLRTGKFLAVFALLFLLTGCLSGGSGGSSSKSSDNNQNTEQPGGSGNNGSGNNGSGNNGSDNNGSDNGGNSAPPPTPPSYELKISVTGLAEGTQLVVSGLINNKEPLESPYTITQNTEQPFADELSEDTLYSLSIDLVSQPEFAETDTVKGKSSKLQVCVFDTAEPTRELLDQEINADTTLKIICKEQLFFAFYNDQYGEELWTTDGTPDGIKMVRDINAIGNSNPEHLTVLGDKLYFSADNEVDGKELWVTDGTETGTKMVKDINANGYGSADLANLTLMDDKLYFSATDGTNGNELWVTDGTAEGTKLVKNINNGGNSSSPNNLTVMNGKLYFGASGGVGRNLYVSDGTPENTTVISHSVTPEHIVAMGNKLFFSGWSGANGTELWESDGTSNGTKLFKDINTYGQASNSSNPKGLIVMGDRFYFSVSDTGFGRSIYVSDGVSITRVRYSPSERFAILNGYVFFIENSTSRLYKAQYTENVQVTDKVNNPENLVVLSDKLYFTANDDGEKLWVTDGEEGNAWSLNLKGTMLGFINNKAWFVNEAGLYTTDGTTLDEGTENIKVELVYP